MFCVVFLVLMLISFGSRFTGYLQNAAAGELAPEVLWLVLALKMPDFVQIVIPFSVFLAILLTLGRLDADSEMPILQSANVGPLQVLGWLAWFVLPIVAFVAYLSFVLSPESRAKFLDVLTSQEIVSEFDVIRADSFRTFDDGARMSYMGEVDREAKTIGKVFLSQRSSSSDTVVLAARGEYHVTADSGNRYLELQNGRRYTREEADRGFSVTAFDKLTQRIQIGAIDKLTNDPTHVPTQYLLKSDPRQRMEWHWRLAAPVMTAVVALIAIGLGRIKPRSGRFGRILPGLLIFVAYYGLALGSMTLFQTNSNLAVLGLWPVHVTMACVAFYLFRTNWRPA